MGTGPPFNSSNFILFDIGYFLFGYARPDRLTANHQYHTKARRANLKAGTSSDADIPVNDMGLHFAAVNSLYRASL